jgi:glycyl-tRNA synthetase
MVDHQALEDDTVTIRDRDTMLQERVPISELNALIAKRVSFNALLSRESVSLQS